MSLEEILMKKPERYVITSAQGESAVNTPFLNALEQYCEANDAQLMVLPMQGSNCEEVDLNPKLLDYVVQGSKKLGPKFGISDFQVKPQQIIPLTGLPRFANKTGSTVFASPKQQMKLIPNSNNELPKAMMTTGAITHANYSDSRIGRIAEQDHTYGALVVELDGPRYHFRHLSAQRNGKFFDLGKKYDGETISPARPEAMILGDWHTGQTCPKVRAETRKMFDAYQPKRIFIHDFFDGYSISHHEEGRHVTKTKKAGDLGVSLEVELKRLAKELEWFLKVSPQDSDLVMVRSNHDEVLHRYFEEARFINEPQNTLLGAQLLVDYIQGEDPLYVGLSKFTDIPDRVTFLTRDDDYKVRGWQLGNHGDLGANGARGSNRSIEYANGKSITGHRHSPELFRDTMVVGTSTKLKLDYNRGYSSWMNSHSLLYDNGKAQLVNIIKGKHKK
jgi:hypothetical protein